MVLMVFRSSGAVRQADGDPLAPLFASKQPAWGQIRVSKALKRHGLSISPAGVRCVW
jgi:hypothetical protein